MPANPATAPSDPAGPCPARNGNSIRRTSSIDTVWDEGFGRPMRMTGRARDLLTREHGRATVLAEAATEMTVSVKREILDISVAPHRAAIGRLVGVRGGSRARATLAELLPDDVRAVTPLYLLLDDFAGASLVAGWVWSQWVDDWPAFMRDSGLVENLGRRGVIEGTCTGLAPGSSALDAHGQPVHETQNPVPVDDLVDPADPIGWHKLARQKGVAMRRARRIDIRCDDELIHIDAEFQDSGTMPGGGRAAVHEYSLVATAGRKDRTLLSLEPTAHILPFPECPGALSHAQRLVGQALAGLRGATPELLPGVLGCTHLNDVLRSLACVPTLVDTLEERISSA